MRPFFSEPRIRRLLLPVQALAKSGNSRLYIVGGVLRDNLVGRRKQNPDIDFALPAGAIAFARRCAARLTAGFVVLDERHGIARVVKKTSDGVFTLDFSDFKGKDLAEDLARRDFTVNSMAAPLEDILEGRPLGSVLIDPLGGRQDLARRLVRQTGSAVFDEDPLRVMRAFSTAAILGATIDPATLGLAMRKSPLLASVSPERVRDELFKIFAVGDSRKYVGLLDDAGVLALVIPEIAAMKRMRRRGMQHLDVWNHTLDTLGRLERAAARLGRLDGVGAYLRQEISPGRDRLSLLKLGCLVHDIGKPSTYRSEGGKVRFYGHDKVGAYMAVGISRRLKLSREEERFLRQLVSMHLRPGFLASAPKVTAKAEFRFFRDAGVEAGSILVLSLADLAATHGYAVVERSRKSHERLIKRLLRAHFRKAECPLPPRLITGDELIRLGLEPSPLFGTIVRKLDELQAEGKITTKAQAGKAALRMARAGRGVRKERNGKH